MFLKMDDKLEQITVMFGEPLPDVTPQQWLELHNNAETENELADTYAGASNEAWWLEDDTYDEDCPESTKILCREWFDLVSKLEQKLLQIAKRENGQGEFQETPRIIWITPIMLRNGYRDANGWWLPISEEGNH